MGEFNGMLRTSRPDGGAFGRWMYMAGVNRG